MPGLGGLQAGLWWESGSDTKDAAELGGGQITPATWSLKDSGQVVISKMTLASGWSWVWKGASEGTPAARKA